MDNWQCEGYVMLAMLRAGLTLEQIKSVKKELWYCFDIYTEEEAETKWKEPYEALND